MRMVEFHSTRLLNSPLSERPYRRKKTIVNSSRIISYLLALLLAVGSITHSAASENCLESVNCAADSLNISLIEYEEDANDLDSLSGESYRNEFTLIQTHSDYGLLLQLAQPSFSHRQIRAPPSSL